MRTASRLVATILVAALAATLLALTTSPATAATRRPAYQAPTSITYLGANCTKIDNGVYEVTYRWRVRGGRYINLGPGGWTRTLNDRVPRGGARLITTTGYRYTGIPGEPTPDQAAFKQITAPLHARHNPRRWRYTEFTRTVNLTCE